jgi:cell division protein FtsB
MKLPIGKLAVVAVALGAIVYGVAEFRGPSGYLGLMQKREQVRSLEQENQKLRAEIDRLDKRVHRLRHDPAAQELEIRKRVGLVKQGETVYVLQEKPKAQGVTNSR